MKKFHSLARHIFFVLICLNISEAQWQTNGPYAGTTAGCFAEYKNNLYAGSDYLGLFLSTDQGVSWKDISKTLQDKSICSILRTDSSLFVGTYYSLHRSTDDGFSWEKVGGGLPNNTRYYSLATFDSVLLAGTSDAGIFCSTDNGSTWTQCYSKPPYLSAKSFVSYGEKLFAGIDFEGVLVSTDHGISWVKSDSGMQSNDINTLFVHDELIFCGSGNLYVSSDSGKNWSISKGWQTGSVSSMVTIDSSLFAGTSGNGVFISSDKGKSWNQVNGGLPSLNVHAMYAIGSKLFASTEYGVFLSTNLGSSWNPIDFRFTNTLVNALASHGDNIYAGTFDGMFSSTDKGSTWVALNNGLTSYEITSLAIQGTNFFAGTPNGLFRSTNNCASWHRVDSGLTGTNIRALAADSVRIFAGDNIRSVFVSTDNGTSWKPLPSFTHPQAWRSSINCIAIHGSDVFVGLGIIGIFRHSNGDTMWVQADSSLKGFRVNSLVVDGNNLYAGTLEHGVFLSTDKGDSWNGVNDGLSNLAISSLWGKNDVIVAGRALGISISWNKGANWENWHADGFVFPRFATVQSVIYQDSTIFAGISGMDVSGVFRYSFSEVTVVRNAETSHEVRRFSLDQNYPNPFNPSTQIKYSILHNSFVSVKVYNLLGQEVAILFEGMRQPGNYEATFDASRLASGVYLYRLTAANFMETKKLLLLK